MDDFARELRDFLISHKFALNHTRQGYLRLFVDGVPVLDITVVKLEQIIKDLKRELELEKGIQ